MRGPLAFCRGAGDAGASAQLACRTAFPVIHTRRRGAAFPRSAVTKDAAYADKKFVWPSRRVCAKRADCCQEKWTHWYKAPG